MEAERKSQTFCDPLNPRVFWDWLLHYFL